MILQIYSVRDNKAGTFSRPFFEHTDAAAVRAFTTAARDNQSQISQFPDDFELHKIGEFDDATAIFVDNCPKFIVNAATLLATKPTVEGSN